MPIHFAKLSNIVLVVVAAGAATTASAQNSNPRFQSFFFDACSGAGSRSSLETRCSETSVGEPGNLSGDSELSLTPAQSLAVSETGIDRQKEAGQEVQQLLEEQRAELQKSAGAEFDRWSLLFNGHWTGFDRKAWKSARGYDGNTWGLQLGTDYRINNRSFVGGFLSYKDTTSNFDKQTGNGANFDAPSSDGSTDGREFSITLFGSYNFTDAFYLDGSLTGGITKYDIVRRAVFQESGRNIPQTNVKTHAHPLGGDFSTTLGAGYDLYWRALSVTPYLRFQYAYSYVEGYRESESAGLQMRYTSNDQHSFKPVAGLNAGYSFSTNWGVLVPQVRAEYEYEALMDGQVTRSRYVEDTGNTEFNVVGPDPDRHRANVGAGLVFVLRDGWIPFADWEGHFGNKQLDQHRVTAGVRKEF